MSSQQQAPKRKKRPSQEKHRTKREGSSGGTAKPRIEKFRPEVKATTANQRPAKMKKTGTADQPPAKKKRKKMEESGRSKQPKEKTSTNTKTSARPRNSEADVPRKKKKRPPQTGYPAKRKEGLKTTQSSPTKEKGPRKKRPNRQQKPLPKKGKPPQSKHPQKKGTVQKNKRGNFSLKIIYMVFLFCTMSVLFTFIGLYVVNRNEMTIFNHRVVRLTDNGMVVPDNAALRTQDLIVVREQAFTQAQPNDIAVFTSGIDNGYIARRVISIEASEEQGYQLSVLGDGQAFGEEEIDAERFVGQVSMSINNVADVFRFIDQNLILSIIFCISLIALFVLLGIYLFT